MPQEQSIGADLLPKTLSNGVAMRGLLCIALLWANALLVDAAPTLAIKPGQAAPPPLQEVLVTSDHPGPALWQVTSGPHRLWILAQPPTPLPATIVWRTKQVEATIAGAQEVILDGGITFNSRRSQTPLSAAIYQDIRKISGQQSSLQ